MSQRERDRRAWEVLGCLPRAHPFALWELPQRRLRCRDLTPQFVKQTVQVVVWVITRKQVEAVQAHSSDGRPLDEPLINPMAFVTLEDDTGTIESTWFPESYRRYGALIESGCPFWVSARVAVDYGETSLEVLAAKPFETNEQTGS
jgi:DNA polymerase-3 subunit alpha/error-prone DNA polymerase